MTLCRSVRVVSSVSQLFALILLASGSFITTAIAQRLPQSTSTTPTEEPSTAPQVSTVPRIVRNVNLVNLVFSVENPHGGYVPALSKEEFRVSEDGRPQQIRFFSAESQVPLTLAWLLDTSPSQTRVLTREQQVSDQFFDQVLTAKDLAFIIGFDVDAEILQDLTSSKRMLKEAISTAHIGGAAPSPVINPGPFPSASHGGATHLWDAIYLACNDRLSQQVGRKAVIVVTDGDDEGSRYKPQDALRALLDTNSILYAVVASDPGFYFGAYGGSGELRHLANATGGRAYEVRHGDMSKAFEQIASELRSQYTLAYRSDRPQLDGTFRRVKIELVGNNHKGEKVRARDGYYADQPAR